MRIVLKIEKNSQKFLEITRKVSMLLKNIKKGGNYRKNSEMLLKFAQNFQKNF